MFFFLQDDIATIMTQYRCRFNDDLKQKYSSYIAAATHKAGTLYTFFIFF